MKTLGLQTELAPAAPARKRRVRNRARSRELVVPVHEIVSNGAVRKICSSNPRKPVTRHTLIRWRTNDGFPEPVRVTDGVELWDAREVRAWLRARERAQ